MTQMTPREIVHELDKHIVGQADAKRAVAIALRNRWRRMQVGEEMRAEITPKNILMIGPTGVGKTEIARRLARLAGAPFIKVEATKFTEVGYVGRDVESIVRDLTDVAVKLNREREMEKVRRRAEDAAEERILGILLRPARAGVAAVGAVGAGGDDGVDAASTRQKFRKMLREGKLDEREIEVELSAPAIGVEIMAPPGMEEMTSQLQSMFQNLGGGRSRTRRLRIRDAFKLLTEEEAGKLINEDDLKSRAVDDVEQNGIVFPGRDRQGLATQRSDRRGRLARGGPARPAPAGGGEHGFDEVRRGTHGSHPVHRLRRIPHREAVRSHSRAPGPVPPFGWSFPPSASTTSCVSSPSRTAR